ncbi:MAG: hypothetical protein ACXW1W_08975 [Methylococcaceae bacterium]
MDSVRQLKIDECFLSSIALITLLLGGLWVRTSEVSEYYLNPDEMQYLIIAKGETLTEVWRRGLFVSETMKRTLVAKKERVNF